MAAVLWQCTQDCHRRSKSRSGSSWVPIIQLPRTYLYVIIIPTQYDIMYIVHGDLTGQWSTGQTVSTIVLCFSALIHMAYILYSYILTYCRHETIDIKFLQNNNPPTLCFYFNIVEYWTNRFSLINIYRVYRYRGLRYGRYCD